MDTPNGHDDRPDPQVAAKRLAGLLSPEAIDGLLADADATGTPLEGPEGLLAR